MKASTASAIVGVGILLLFVTGLLGLIPIQQPATSPPSTTGPVQLGHVAVYFIDVGQGDATFIDTRDKDVLIDGGTRSKGVVVTQFLVTLKVVKIDVVIATHPDADHIGGLITVLESNLVVPLVMYNGEAKDTETYRDFIAAAQGRALLVAQRGQTFQLDNATVLTVLNPVQPLEFTDENENSVVVRVQVGTVAMVFTGDCELRCEESVLRSGLAVMGQVLKVGHHGSRSSSSGVFLDAVKPSMAVISVGIGNRYGHPHAEVLARLAARGVVVYRTDVSGTVTVIVEGNRVAVQTER